MEDAASLLLVFKENGGVAAVRQRVKARSVLNINTIHITIPFNQLIFYTTPGRPITAQRQIYEPHVQVDIQPIRVQV